VEHEGIEEKKFRFDGVIQWSNINDNDVTPAWLAWRGKKCGRKLEEIGFFVGSILFFLLLLLFALI
jgi:hypothetical protein